MTFKGHTVKEERWGDKHKCFAGKNVPLWAAHYIQQHTLYPTATATALGAPWWYLRPARSGLETGRRGGRNQAIPRPSLPRLWWEVAALPKSPQHPSCVKRSVLLSCSHRVKVKGCGFAVTGHVPTPCKKKWGTCVFVSGGEGLMVLICTCF